MDYSCLAIDGHSVRASELDQSFIGQTFGLKMIGYVLYGRLGAIRRFENHVLLTLADVPGHDIHLVSDEEVYFFNGAGKNQINGLSDGFLNHSG